MCKTVAILLTISFILLIYWYLSIRKKLSTTVNNSLYNYPVFAIFSEKEALPKMWQIENINGCYYLDLRLLKPNLSDWNTDN
jgi:hypothetical protein